MPSTENTAAPQDAPKERADSRRKRLRLLDAARRAVAEQGFEVSAAEIAERAEVGVGTLYRRFGSKEALLEAALAETLIQVTDAAGAALADADAVNGLNDLLTAITRHSVASRGMAEFTVRSGNERSADFQRHTETLREAIEELTTRAQRAGDLRPDVTWRDVAVIAQTAAAATHCLGIEAGEQQWARSLTVMMDGLRSTTPHPLPGAPPQDHPTR